MEMNNNNNSNQQRKKKVSYERAHLPVDYLLSRAQSTCR